MREPPERKNESPSLSADRERELVRALATSEARLKHLLDAAFEGIWQIDGFGKTVFANKRMADLLGYSPDELQQLTVFDVSRPEDRARGQQVLRRRLDGDSEQYDWRFVRKDGSELWCLVSGTPVYDEHGKAVGAIGMVADITERKHSEQRLQRMSRLYAVSSSVNDAIVRIRDPSALYKLACRIAVEQGGVSLAWIGLRDKQHGGVELVGQCGGSDDYIRRALERIRSVPHSPGPGSRALRDGAVYLSNDIANDQTFFWKGPALELGLRSAAFFPLKNASVTIGVVALYAQQTDFFNEEEVRVLTAMADNISFVTESAAKDAALREAEEKVAAQAALLDKATDAIVLHGLDDTVHYWNRGAERLYGWSAAETVGNKITQLTCRDSMERRALVAKLIEAGEWRGELTQFTKSGAEVVVDASWTLVRDDLGKPRSILAINTDITERKKLEAQFLTTQRLESIGTLAGGIAHDFNNILAAITGNAKLALAELSDAGPLRAHLREIEKASLRAGELVRQILTFGRRQEAQRRVISLQDVASEALRLLRATLPAQIEIRADFDDRTPLIAADATLMHQVMVNLGANAAHAMRGHGGVLSVCIEPVEIDAGSSDASYIPHDLPSGSYARLVVGDTGVGMDSATQSRIFEPFFTTKAAGQGSGLGLSVVHGIVRSHDGAIAVISTPGGGSTFCLYFPKAPEQIRAAEIAAETQAQDGSGQHILYVDDEEALVFLSTRVLERLGYRVTGRTDANQALAEFRADPSRFDAVVSDLSMPGMTGPELARAMLEIRSDLPIVLTSGYIRDEDMKLVRELGIRDLVLKPNTVEDLGAALHRVLERDVKREARRET